MPVPTLPPTSLLWRALPRIDFLDTYRLPLAPGACLTATEVARALFQEGGPGWINGLLRLRNALGTKVGLRATAPAAPRPPEGRLAVGDVLGPFETFAVTPAEVVLGLDDRHLDFRVSVLVVAGAAHPTVLVSTAVQHHNAAGRLYFALIRPFHGLVVPALLRDSRRRLPVLSR